MRRVIAIGATFMVVGLIAAIVDRPDPAFPGDSLWILQAPDTLTLYTVDFGGDGPDWPHTGELAGYKTYAQAEITDRNTQRQILVAIRHEIIPHPDRASGCFNPRIGLRARRGGEEATLLICFSCQYIEIKSGGLSKTSVIKGDSQELFDSTLHALGLTPVPTQ